MTGKIIVQPLFARLKSRVPTLILGRANPYPGAVECVPLPLKPVVDTLERRKVLETETGPQASPGGAFAGRVVAGLEGGAVDSDGAGVDGGYVVVLAVFEEGDLADVLGVVGHVEEGHEVGLRCEDKGGEGEVGGGFEVQVDEEVSGHGWMRWWLDEVGWGWGSF